MIVMMGNYATEEEVWETLNVMNVYSVKNYFCFGNCRELIPKDFVKKKYLKYQQVVNNDSVQYEFPWSPRLHAKTSKTKKEILANVHRAHLTTFPSQYAEALLEGDMYTRISFRATSSSRTTAYSTTMSSGFHHIYSSHK